MILFVSMDRPIPSIHVFHSNVGGVGKTHLAALLADYFKQKSRDLRCFDSDSYGTGLSAYDGLNVEQLWKDDQDGGGIDFDPVFESGAEVSILDCGPVGYGAFLQYIKQNRLQECGGWMLHVPLMRYRLESSKYGFERMNMPQPLPFVFWLNAFMDGPFTLNEVLSCFSMSSSQIAGAINLAGTELELPSCALDSNMRGLTLSERIEVQTGMKKFRLQQIQKSFGRLFDDFFRAE
jgi:hypothetical protein